MSFLKEIIRNFYPTHEIIYTSGCLNSRHQVLCKCEMKTINTEKRISNRGWEYSHMRWNGDLIWTKGFKKIIQIHSYGR